MITQVQNKEYLSQDFSHLKINATLRDLYLYPATVKADQMGKYLVDRFQTNPLLPGVLIVDNHQLLGMISRRKFLEKMSQPYSLELFLKRPIYALFEFIKTPSPLMLLGEVLIIEAGKKVLSRSSDLLDEPIVVKLAENNYRLLDIQQLLIAQAKIHDLTRHLLEEKSHQFMIQTEKMAGLGRMIAGIAHEIRNPVNFVHGNLDFLANYQRNLIRLITFMKTEEMNKTQAIQDLENEIELDYLLEDSPRLLTSMYKGTNQLVKIVNSLYNFSRMDENKKQLININDCLESVLLILNSHLKQQIRVTKNYHFQAELMGYNTQLSQVFMNLISNSIDSLKEKQKTINDHYWLPKITITTEKIIKDTAFIQINITDNGMGIPQDIQHRIFENFVTTKPQREGTGLGLAISYEIITRYHQGEIHFNSCEGEGTEFQIILPQTVS